MINNKRPLMGTDNILELQDNGYKSTVSALSEIIDNSIQANAKNIDIILIRNTTRDYDEIDENPGSNEVATNEPVEHVVVQQRREQRPKRTPKYNRLMFDDYWGYI